jgi:archaellum component FlaC
MEGEEAPAPAPEMEGAPEGEGQEGGEASDPAAMLAEEAKGLSDEELDHMIEVLSQEKASRQAAEPAPAAAPAPAPEMEPAEKSMKEEFKSLAKSIDALSKNFDALSKDVATIKSAKPAVKAVSKPAVTSRTQVLEKSAPVKQRLTKSETVDAFQSAIRSGKVKKQESGVNAGIMASLIDSNEEQLPLIQDHIEKTYGIELKK